MRWFDRNWWGDLRVQHKVWAILLLLLIPLLSAMTAHLYLIQQLLTIERQRHQAILAREQTHILRRLSIDIEDAFRGYLLTRQSAFLAPLEEAATKLQPAIDRMTELAQKVPGLQDDIQGIEHRLKELLSSKQMLLQQFQSGEEELVLRYVRSGQGLSFSDTLRHDLRAIEDRLGRELNRSEERTDELSRSAFWGLLFVVMGGIVLGLTGIRLLTRSITHPLEVLRASVTTFGQEAESRQALDSISIQSSDELGQLARSYEEMAFRIRGYIHELETINAIGHEINTIGPDGLDGALKRITDRAVDLIKADTCLVMQRNDRMGCWIIEAASGEWNDRLRKTVMLWEELPVCVQAFERCHPAIGKDLRSDSRSEVARRNLIGDSMLSIPLRAQGKPFGVLALLRESKVAHQDWNLRLATGLAEEAALAISNVRLYEASHEKEKGLAARLRQLEYLAETLAHDLKGPGQRMEGLASILLKEYHGHLDERAAKWLRLIEQNGQELVERVENILAVARVGARQGAVVAVDASVVIGDVLKARAGELEQCQARIHVAREFPLVACHRDYLRQVFDNLISNALKFSGEGAPPHITISMTRNDKMVCFEVSDCGIGIPAQQHERVFEPFVRLQLNESTGSGIGLTIVKRIVELYGGRVWIESNIGTGCTVKFTLPALSDFGPPSSFPDVLPVDVTSPDLFSGAPADPHPVRPSVDEKGAV